MRLLKPSIPSLLFCLFLHGCEASNGKIPAHSPNAKQRPSSSRHDFNPDSKAHTGKLIHVVVALCDNKYQGIVPVPERIGNGDDPANNLYWGASFGVKTFLVRSGGWSLVSSIKKPGSAVLERCIFKHEKQDVYLIADAYRGREIERATADFFSFAAGRAIDSLEVATGVRQTRLYSGGAADLIVYVGHDGLMDFTLSDYPKHAGGSARETIMLACISKRFFRDPLRAAGAFPLLWTTGLMAPEAYVLKAALDGWMNGEAGESLRKRAATAYQKYQKCGMKGALGLFATGW